MALPTICKNKECGKHFKRKNSKQKYCSLKCKNRANYIKYLSDNSLDITKAKAYKKNVKLINDLFERGKVIISLQSLYDMGFDFNILVKKYDKSSSIPFFTVGNYNLITYDVNSIKIQTI